MEIWIVEKFETIFGTDRTEILGLFSTREKAEKFVARKFPEWKQSWTDDHQSSYNFGYLDTVSVYSMVLDSEDE